jgi:methionyl-tRNA formyltransferase
MTSIFVLFVDEPVFHPAILSSLARLRPGEIIGVGGVEHGRQGTTWSYLRRQLSFWGTRGFVKNSSSVMWRRVADRLPRRVVHGCHSLRSVCAEHAIPFQTVHNVNDASFVRSLAEAEPDVVVSSQGQIFRRPLLETPRLGCINRHSGLLPAYGGLKPVFWAMLNGETEVGVSVHLMEQQIDSGRVLAQVRVPVRDNSTVYSLYREIFGASAGAIDAAIDVLLGVGEAPDTSGLASCYYPEPSRWDVRSFKTRGLRLA